MADPEQRYITQNFIFPSNKGSEVGLDKCKLCVQFAQQATSNLLNIILSESWYYTEQIPTQRAHDVETASY